ncbi:gp53-like domain-containing protein [Aeromonas enteropelogenes]|uniref:gp53-like domain-containing protein n=1 Tax=Aeromonas enteropelogenes TaxID=29489 RepID=UPI003B9E8D1A
MANVPETPSFDAGIYQIETTDPVLGGPNGIANAQAKGLANRTAFLKQQIDHLNSGELTPAWIASQDYVHSELQKLDAKQSVRAATTANITLSGVQTIDGVVLTVGDRVLVKDQVEAAQNGIYQVSAQNWSRTTDADTGNKLNSGSRVSVEAGAINAGKVWYLATQNPILLGSTSLVFNDEHQTSTETFAGQIRIATQPETDAGQSDNIAVTPKKLRKGISMLLAANGYIVFPSWLGGFVIQWGTLTTPENGLLVVNYPISFPTKVFSAYATANQNFRTCANMASFGLSSMQIRTWRTDSNAEVASVAYWMAIGV